MVKKSHKKLLQQLGLIFVVWFLIFYVGMWALSLQRDTVRWGVSFDQAYAASLGLNWRMAYLDLLDDMKPRYIRLSAAWSQVEVQKNGYNFTDVDWMMNEAAKRRVKVILAIGQKAPRWPECYLPSWASTTLDTRKAELLSYTKAVVNRYGHNTALEYWQVENEPFIHFDFGNCQDFQPDWISDEIKTVKTWDKQHRVIVTDSGEMSLWWGAAHAGDILGTTVYRIVRTPNGGVFSYGWLPPGFYRLRATLLGKSQSQFFVSELQAEPWFANSDALHTPIAEQEKTMTPERLLQHFDFATRVGASRSYIWGVEWAYWMKTVKGDARYWEVMKGQVQAKKS